MKRISSFAEGGRKGGPLRWEGVSKQQRSAAMRKVRRAAEEKKRKQRGMLSRLLIAINGDQHCSPYVREMAGLVKQEFEL